MYNINNIPELYKLCIFVSKIFIHKIKRSFAFRRDTCNVCNGPKVQIEEERTGLGGGFNERENVEYKRHNEDEVCCVVEKMVTQSTSRDFLFHFRRTNMTTSAGKRRRGASA